MSQPTLDFDGEPSPSPVKLCECGCGEPAPRLQPDESRACPSLPPAGIARAKGRGVASGTA